MSVALLSIGTELLRGEVVDAKVTWLAAELTEMGFAVQSLEAVSDDRGAIAAALRRTSEQHSLIIAVGGVGPTPDDVTVEAVAHALGVGLHHDDDVLAAIRRRTEDRGIELVAGHRKQAMLPEGATPLPNADGTAPGFIVRLGRATVYVLPGAGSEMRRMFREQVAPRVLPSATKDACQITLHVYGLIEAAISERLRGLDELHPAVSVSYRAHRPEVDVKVLGRAANYAEARDRAAVAAREVRTRLGDAVYGEGDDTLALVAARSVRSRGWRLAAAEACTGGLIAQQLTMLPTNDFFAGSAVTHDNSSKTRLLGVSEDTLRGHGAVSAEVAAEMAEGARRAFECEVALAVTGVAGAAGATAATPHGACFWALAHPGGTVVEHAVFPGECGEVQLRATHAVLDLLRRTVRG